MGEQIPFSALVLNNVVYSMLYRGHSLQQVSLCSITEPSDSLTMARALLRCSTDSLLLFNISTGLAHNLELGVPQAKSITLSLSEASLYGSCQSYVQTAVSRWEGIKRIYIHSGGQLDEGCINALAGSQSLVHVTLSLAAQSLLSFLEKRETPWISVRHLSIIAHQGYALGRQSRERCCELSRRLLTENNQIIDGDCTLFDARDLFFDETVRNRQVAKASELISAVGTCTAPLLLKRKKSASIRFSMLRGVSSKLFHNS